MSIAFCAGSNSDIARKSGLYAYLSEGMKDYIDSNMELESNIGLLLNLDPYSVHSFDYDDIGSFIQICNEILNINGVDITNHANYKNVSYDVEDEDDQACYANNPDIAIKFFIDLLTICRSARENEVLVFAIGD